jgi:acetyl-CoA carboxylase carboxyl transferase subunit alpha
MAQRVKLYLLRTLRELLTIPLDDLLRVRYDKFRRMGVFMESV